MCGHTKPLYDYMVTHSLLRYVGGMLVCGDDHAVDLTKTICQIVFLCVHIVFYEGASRFDQSGRYRLF